MDTDLVHWIEHHATRIIAIAGFLGGAGLVVFGGETPGILNEANEWAGGALALASAALNVANRALSAYRASAGIDADA